MLTHIRRHGVFKNDRQRPRRAIGPGGLVTVTLLAQHVEEQGPRGEGYNQTYGVLDQFCAYRDCFQSGYLHDCSLSLHSGHEGREAINSFALRFGRCKLSSISRRGILLSYE